MANRKFISVLAKVHAAVVIVGATTLAAFGISCFAMYWDPRITALGCIIIGFSCVMGLMHYSAVFRRHHRPAMILSVVWFVVGVIGPLWMISAFRAASFEQPTAAAQWNLPLSLSLVATIGIASGGLYWTWAQLLTSRRNDELPAHRISLAELLAIMAVIALLISQSTYFLSTARSQFAENVSREESPFQLPETATNVSYCRGTLGAMAYEFSISEAEFLAWATTLGIREENGYGVKLEAIPFLFTMPRYPYLLPSLNGPPAVNIFQGYCYVLKTKGRSVYYAFDTSTNRAYYFSENN